VDEKPTEELADAIFELAPLVVGLCRRQFGGAHREALCLKAQFVLLNMPDKEKPG
jgi:hypothetical protein